MRCRTVRAVAACAIVNGQAIRENLERAHHAHNQAFDVERILVQVNHDGEEVRIFSDQEGLPAFEFQALDGGVALDARDDDLARAR